MGHRAKHRRANWGPQRLAKAAKRAENEYQRQLAARLDAEVASGVSELEPGS